MRPVLLAGLLIAFSAAPLFAEPGEPAAVSRRIDVLLDRQLAAKKIPASPPSDDAEFLRRAYLHLHGRPPSADRAAAFIDSREPDKRRKLIDELLAHQDYGRNFSTIWQTLILPEQNNFFFLALVGPKNLTAFGSWLATGFNKNQAWDGIAPNCSQPRARSRPTPPWSSAMSSMERARVRPDLLAVSTSRLFLGVQLQCVECHDHVTNDWKQADFWGLAAFFGKTRFSSDGNSGTGEIGEWSGGRPNPLVKGSSIVIPATGGNKGAGRVVKAKFLQGDEPPLEEVESYRGVLVDWMLADENPFFAPAAVNRWWGHFFGRGLTHPIDDMHAGHPLEHAELLKLLATELRESKYDLKHLIRCICNTQAYQRSSRAVAGNENDHDFFSHVPVMVMSPDVLYDSLAAVLGVSEIRIDAPDTLRVLLTPAELTRLRFVRFFRTRTADATELTHGIPHALSLLNSETLNAVSPTARSLASLLPEAAVERLFLTVLARRPTAAEAKQLAEFLAKRNTGRPSEDYQAVLWILLNTSEFVLNH